MDVYEILSTYAPVVGVHGNVDDEEVKNTFPMRKILEVGKYRVRVVHGHVGKKSTLKNAMNAFADEDIDIIIFGHSHIPLVRYAGKTLLINPGSPTYKRKLPFYSYGVLELSNTIKVSLEYF